MKKIIFLLAPLALVAACTPLRTTKGSSTKKFADDKPVEYAANSSAAQMDYIQKYKNLAINEMESSGIPASIKLAQGMLESASGLSELAMNANNHFGIKCAGSQWSGSTYHKKDDDFDKDGKLTESCFRRYSSVAESFADHSAFIRDPRKYNRYGFLFNLSRTDYKAWARGLQSAGYATSSDYADRLISLIERYQLYQYDRPGNGAAGVDPNNTGLPASGSSGSPNRPAQPAADRPGVPTVPPNRRIGRVNDVKVVLSLPGETLDDIARAYRINTEKVVDYNDRGYTPGARLLENTRVYIQRKKSRWHGRATHHFVREGQNMFQISQQYGIRLDALLARNNMPRGVEPATGEQVRLKGKRKKGETIQFRDTSNDGAPTTPATPPPGTLRPDGDVLFDVSKDDKTDAQGKPVPPASTPGRPATTGVPYPPDPVPSTSPSQQPQGPVRPQPPTTTQPPAAPAGAQYHVVVQGDTLFNISKRYNTTVENIRRLNNMTDNNIKLGQRLRVK